MLGTKSIKDIRQSTDSIKDKIKDKSEKLASAMYLVTNFLNDLDEIKWKLRAKAMGLKVNLTLGVKDIPTPSVWPIETILSDITEIICLIDLAVLDRQASVMNFSILRDGYRNLQQEFQGYLNSDEHKQALLPIINSDSISSKVSRFSLGSPTSKNDNTARRDKIIAFIKQHNWSSTRDIAQFMPEVGGKTIQRELAELVRLGTLKKTGERRWSRYNSSV